MLVLMLLQQKKRRLELPKVVELHPSTQETSQQHLTLTNLTLMSTVSQKVIIHLIIIISLATLTQLIKDCLPEGTRMSQSSCDLIIQLSMHFLNYLSDTSNNVCNAEGRKTITPSHIVKALKVSFDLRH